MSYMDNNLLHIMALKDNQIYDLKKKIGDYEEILKNIRLVGDDYSRSMAKGVLNGTLEVVKESDLVDL